MKKFYEDLTEIALCEASKAINEVFDEIIEDRRKGKKPDDYKKGKPLESLAKEKIKSRLVTMPKIYMVSSYPLDKESLLELVKMRPILTNHEDCTIIYLGTYYKPLKRRIKK